MKKMMMFLVIIGMFINSITISNGAVNIPITMYMNGNYIKSDVLPFTSNGTTYVPIRVLTDAIGIYDVAYDPSEDSVTITQDFKKIKLFMNQSLVQVNDHEYYINGKPTITDSRMMVPLEFVAENFGCEIKWDKLTRSLLLTKADLPKAKTTNVGYTPEDVLWLARIVQVEAGSAEYACKIGVANVVINRKNSGVFPQSIHGVIFHPGQFPPAHKPSFSSLIPSEECIRAAKNALNGENNVSRALYFNNRPFSSKTDDFYKYIGGEYFYF